MDDNDLGMDFGDGRFYLSRRCGGCGGLLEVTGLNLDNIRSKRWCSERCRNVVRWQERKAARARAIEILSGAPWQPGDGEIYARIGRF